MLASMSTARHKGLDESLGFNLNRVAQLYRRELIRALAPYELTPEQWQILAALSSRAERLTQGEIAALTSKDKHSTSRMLERMEQAGWIVRAPHPVDGRAAAVALGPREHELAAIRATLSGHFERIDAVLTEAQQEQLLALLRILRSHLGDGAQESSPPL